MMRAISNLFAASQRFKRLEHQINILTEKHQAVRYSLDRIEQMVQSSDKESPRKSFSLEAEDLLVDNIFSNVLKLFRPGFYLDIGAAHPIKYSNTYFFYKLGWNGICVEPNPDFQALYKDYRPHDTVINAGISGSDSGILTYHKFEHPYLNGFYDQDVIDWHVKSNGQTYLGSTEIQCISIGEFLKNNVNRPVDFLNIDVETLDVEILSAWDWDACKPLLICAEIHTSSLKDVVESDVAKILGAAGYTPVSRGWLSTIFVRDNELKNAVVIGR